MQNTHQALREVERAAAAPFIHYPATPWWYPLFVAAAYTTMATGAVLAMEFDRRILGIALPVLAIGALLLYMQHYRRQWGTWPRMIAAPREIRAAYRVCLVALAGSVVLIVTVWATLGWPAGLIVVFLTMLGLFTVYERVIYPRAAQRVRERLG